MTVVEFKSVWPVLRRQVRTLCLPWLDRMARADRDPFRVLISCILSLRTKDRVTGQASERLFRLASTPGEMAKLQVGKIERAIYPVGFYRVKAVRIRKISAELADRYHGRVPDTIDELLTLEGVGRKTANLVVILGYDRDGICVDTHVHRIVNRWGLVRTWTALQTEFHLREVLPVRYWKRLNGILVAFGQGICKPVSPLCSRCSIHTSCDRVGVFRSR
jgi:endonuclease III